MSVDRVMKELKTFKKYGIREFQFYDASFTTHKKRVLELCDRMVKEKLNLIWACEARTDKVDKDMLTAMKKAGCIRIQFGIESGSQKILDRIKKGITPQIVEKAVNLTNKVGISTLGFFMFGLPGETEATMEETVQLAMRIPLTHAAFSLTRSFPNTELYEEHMKEIRYDYFSEFTLGNVNSNQILKCYGTNLSVQRIQKKVKEAYKKFYYRPIQIMRVLPDLKSPVQIQRYAQAFFDMTMNIFFNKEAGMPEMVDHENIKTKGSVDEGCVKCSAN
jgi:radical SAM superfamily enzyme YgiQ (UPF0313 family)